MKKQMEYLLIGLIGIGSSIIGFSSSNNSKNIDLLQDNYNQLNRKYDSLEVIIKSEIYGKNLSVRRAKELMIKKRDSLEGNLESEKRMYEAKY